MISVRDLIYDYPTKRALHGLDFDIAAGTITALVGPNGAGKSTLMRCLAGLDHPLTGAIVVDGLDVLADPREAHARIGYLQDFFGLYDDLTVRRCLSYFAMAYGVPRAERTTRVQRAARWLGLDDRLEEKAGSLSRGLRQRLAVAQAMIHEPKVLMLDEPASGLDPEARASLSRLLVNLCRDGMTIIVSSHILTELEDYSSHMLMIHDGRIVEHCAIGASRPAEARRLRIGFTERRSQWESRALELLERNELVTVAEIAADRVEVDFAGDLDRQAELLRGLVAGGLPVASFAAVQRSMQDVYLERLGGQGRP